jgi:hypothetical protein
MTISTTSDLPRVILKHIQMLKQESLLLVQWRLLMLHQLMTYTLFCQCASGTDIVRDAMHNGKDWFCCAPKGLIRASKIAVG